MTYTATGAGTFRSKGGSLSKKLGYEFAAIKTETDALRAVDAAGLKVAKGTLAGGLANAFSFAWQNPESSAIVVSRVVIDVTTVGAVSGALLDVGPGATATTHSDTLIDGLDITTAVITADNITNKGSNGLSLCKLDAAGGTTDYITGQILVQAAAALVGKYYIFYTVV